MPVIWCSLSSHGFGHGAQIVPILNELGRRYLHLHVLLRTNIPKEFFDARMTVNWEMSPASQDIGCVQRGPLTIDAGQTWLAYEQFHAHWDEKVRLEAKAIQVYHPDMVMSNISYLGIEAGKQAGIPTVAVGSLSWDQVLIPFLSDAPMKQEEIIRHIQRSYSRADLMIRLHPGISMPAFPHIHDVGPIYASSPICVEPIRTFLGLGPQEKMVLVALGGIPLDQVPIEPLEQLSGYHVLVGGSSDRYESSRVRPTNSLPFSFQQILTAADIIITKPGYATVIEAVQYGIPLVYVRRNNFIDEQGLVDYAHHYGRALEISMEHFVAGKWKEALDAVQVLPRSHACPPPSGVGKAADELGQWLKNS